MLGLQSILLLAWPTSSSIDSLSFSAMFVGGFGTETPHCEGLVSSQTVNLGIEQCVWNLLLLQ